MKRIERNTYNSLRKSITADIICVEISTEYTHEGRQGIHEMLTIEKHVGITFKPNRTLIEYDGDVYTIIDRKTKEPLFAAIPRY